MAHGGRRVAAAAERTRPDHLNSGKAMEVLIMVDDPGAFTTPWSAVQRFRRVPREWTEDICAENNFDFLQYEVVPLPQANKADF
jgi:hypothetical protein